LESLPAKITKLDEGYSPLLVKVVGEAIHPIMTIHTEDPVEFQKRFYLETELQKAAPTLTNGFFTIDHSDKLPFPSRITNSRWNPEKHAIEFEALVTREIAEEIKNGQVKGVSIELSWLQKGGGIRYVDGIAPFGFKLAGLSLLKNLKPGDPQAFIRLVEGVLEPVFENLILVAVRDLHGVDLSKVFTRWVDFPNHILGFYSTDIAGNAILLWLTFDRKLWTQTRVDGWKAIHQSYFQLQPQPKPVEERKEPTTLADWVRRYEGWKS